MQRRTTCTQPQDYLKAPLCDKAFLYVAADRKKSNVKRMFWKDSAPNLVHCKYCLWQVLLLLPRKWPRADGWLGCEDEPHPRVCLTRLWPVRWLLSSLPALSDHWLSQLAPRRLPPPSLLSGYTAQGQLEGSACPAPRPSARAISHICLVRYWFSQVHGQGEWWGCPCCIWVPPGTCDRLCVGVHVYLYTCVSVCTCMCAYLSVHMCVHDVYMYACIHVYARVWCVHVCTWTCLCRCMCIHVHMYMSVHPHTCACMHVQSVHVCVCVCMCACVCVCAWVCLSMCVCVSVHVSLCACVCVCAWVCVHVSMYKCLASAWVYTCMHCTCLCMCLHACIHVCACVHVYTCVCACANMCTCLCMCMGVSTCACVLVCACVCLHACMCTYLCLCMGMCRGVVNKGWEKFSWFNFAFFSASKVSVTCIAL